MKNYLKLAGLILALQFMWLHAAQANDAAIKQAMVKKYQLLTEAYHNVDAESIIKQLTPDFVALMPAKYTLRRAEFEVQQRALFDSITRVNSAALRINKVTIEKGRVIVLATQSLDFTLADQTGHSARYKESSVSRDIWIQSSGQWKIKRSEFVSGNASINGKPLKF